jgi:phosphatidylinositol alpha-mannosyltransferase/D-inositol-3-phosphate glycosyltransferase
VIDGETGLLVDATDHAEAAAALIALLADPDRAAALGAAGQARARTFSWERMATAVETLVADLVGPGT